MQVQDGKNREDAVLKGLFESWAQGFVVGSLFQFGLQTAPGGPAFPVYPADAASINLWTTKFCRERPLESVMAAEVALVRELIERQKKGLLVDLCAGPCRS
jgi:hypothetical protein